MTNIYRIGVLALQGAFIEHIEHLNRVARPDNVQVLVHAVRTLEELEICDALVIPGGESTVMLSQAARGGILDALQSFVADPSRPTWGSCAGMILMAAKQGISGGKKPQKGLDGIPTMRVVRNLYGGQLESFETPVLIPELPEPDVPFPAIFIRAPAIHSFLPPPAKPSLKPLQALCVLPHDMAATAPDATTHPFGQADEDALRIVMLRQGKKLVTSFHPELSPDIRIHEYFIRKICLDA